MSKLKAKIMKDEFSRVGLSGHDDGRKRTKTRKRRALEIIDRPADPEKYSRHIAMLNKSIDRHRAARIGDTSAITPSDPRSGIPFPGNSNIIV